MFSQRNNPYCDLLHFSMKIYEMECLRASVSEIKFLYLGKCKDNIL